MAFVGLLNEKPGRLLSEVWGPGAEVLERDCSETRGSGHRLQCLMMVALPFEVGG